MDCYSRFIRHFAVLSVVLYALSDGHLFCAHFHCSHAAPQRKYDDCGCDHSHHPASEEQEEPCDHECLDTVQPAIRVHGGVNELEYLLQNFSVGFVTATPTECQPNGGGARDVSMTHYSAASLRLHLLYRSLLI